MKLIPFLLFLLLSFPYAYTSQAQTDSTQNTSDEELFNLAVNAYNDHQYLQAYDYIKQYEAKVTWFSSLGYWKAITIDKIIKYNNVSETKFIELNEVVQRIMQEAEKKTEKERDLYDEHYRDIILIEEKLNFVVIKLRWKNDASFTKAIAAFQKQDYGVAKLHAEEAAKTNNGAALLMLGQINEIGYAAQPRNFKKAMAYYESAFLAGSYDAAYHIGYLYFHGYGVIKNINLAFDWCKIAASYNYIPAMKELSNMYKHGLGTSRNTELSKYWWDMATTQPE